MKTFTKDFIKENSGCYDSEKLSGCSFMQQEGNTVTLESIVKSEIPPIDKFWFVNDVVATLEENKQLAVQCAEIVLPIYEKYYPGNMAIRQVIEATKLCIAGHISKSELMSKKRAVVDARAADFARTNGATYDTYAAHAADAAAYAAAYAAADAAAYAAVAAYAYADVAAVAYYAAVAAYHAVADADSVGFEEQLLQILIDYSMTKK